MQNIDCSACNGLGTRPRKIFFFTFDVICPSCGGTGSHYHESPVEMPTDRVAQTGSEAAQIPDADLAIAVVASSAAVSASLASACNPTQYGNGSGMCGTG